MEKNKKVVESSIGNLENKFTDGAVHSNNQMIMPIALPQYSSDASEAEETLEQIRFDPPTPVPSKRDFTTSPSKSCVSSRLAAQYCESDFTNVPWEIDS